MKSSERRQENIFRNFFEFSPIGMALVDFDFKLRRVNPKICDLFEHTFQEFTALAVSDIIDDQYSDYYISQLDKLSKGEIEIFKTENPFIRKNKGIFHGVFTAMVIRDESGVITNILILIEDITDKKVSELRLESINNLNAVINDLLQIPMQNIPLQDQLDQILSILINTPHFPTKEMAAVFLVDEGSDNMTMQASAGLFKEPKEKCSNLPVGACLCGEVAKNGKALFTGIEDYIPGENHCNVEPHGKYIVPVKSKGMVLGVLSVYLSKDRKREDYEMEFLQSVANIIAGIIEHMRSEEIIKTSLKEKVVLLREIHHRVKNNLQIISSLLGLQSKKITDEAAFNMFLDTQSRVKSMALIHENLYQSNDLAGLRFDRYIKELAGDLFATYKLPATTIKFDAQMEQISLDIDTAISCSLAICEIISNALKYAFSQTKNGVISVHLKQMAQDEFSLIIKDNGVGLPDDFDIKKTKSLGLQLVNDLIVRKLKGALDIDGKDGTTFNMTFKALKYKKRLDINN